ncbi:MAG TPA: hypothetical protein DCZ92_06720 [Elusimicrobia bacterium]|nr:MAG: hypothetical protein A2016_05245 [Elusimicrobia bacterium GWF2_62_30]HBA60498.1 hypothetical protein [Elusimicrobiota bacterium]
MNISKERPAGQKAVVLLLGALFALLSAEAALRLGGFAYRAAQERRNRIAVGREGYRIMCLGESTTAGGEDAWPVRLERALSRRYPEARFSVINKGMAGVNSSELMRELEKNLDQVRPGLVIAMMGLNDGFIRYYDGIAGAESRLFRHFRLYKLTKLLLNKGGAPRPLPVPVPAQAAPYSGPVDPYLPYLDGKKDMARQEAALRGQIARDPGDAASLYLLGRYWALDAGWKKHDAELGKQGEELLLRAARLAPKNSFIPWTLGMYAILQKKDPARGLPLLEKAAELNPSAANWYYVGRAYKDHGLPEKADAALLKALAPGAPLGIREEAAFELCWLYISRREFKKAEDLMREALELDPYNEKVQGALAAVYTESGRPELARKHAARLSSTRGMFTATTRANFAELRRALKSRGIRLAVMQYPLCDPAPLRALFEDAGDIIFIDNDRAFRKAVREKGYTYYFKDMFAGNFGHCTGPGNDLIAESAADALSGYFGVR